MSFASESDQDTRISTSDPFGTPLRLATQNSRGTKTNGRPSFPERNESIVGGKSRPQSPGYSPNADTGSDFGEDVRSLYQLFYAESVSNKKDMDRGVDSLTHTLSNHPILASILLLVSVYYFL